MKSLQKRVFRHVEHLRLLHMPLFQFLKHFSKIHDEITAKTRFSACRVCANTVYASICVSRKDFKSWWWKQCKNRVFRYVEHLRMLRMQLFAFLKQFSKNWWWKQCRKCVFWHVEHLRLLRMPLFAFLKQFSKIHDEITAKTPFSACWTFATLRMPLFAILKHFSKIDNEITPKTRFPGMLNICDYCVCLYLRF